MRASAIQNLVRDAAAAAEVLGDAQHLINLTVEAIAQACPRGVAVVFLRSLRSGAPAMGGARADGAIIPPERWRLPGPLPWIVDIDCVPGWQRDTWIEPINAGVHGPDFFSSENPVMQLAGLRRTPDYGRLMACCDGRMAAWAGVYVDGARGFQDRERLQLRRIAAALARPLQIASLVNDGAGRAALAPRQSAIAARVASGWSNKRIARDLDISPATVKTHLERLYRITGAANRAALAAWWRR